MTDAASAPLGALAAATITVPDLDGFFETRLHKGQDPYVPDLVALGFGARLTHE